MKSLKMRDFFYYSKITIFEICSFIYFRDIDGCQCRFDDKTQRSFFATSKVIKTIFMKMIELTILAN